MLREPACNAENRGGNDGGRDASGATARVGELGDRPGGWGTVERVRGWRIVDLHGTDRRQGELYGALLREELLRDWVPANEDAHAALPATFLRVLRRQQRRFVDFFDPRAAERALGLEQ